MKIAAVVEETGVSKELIHHYLRLGLLPPSPQKGHYDRRQVRLLAIIRALRDEHHLPLETIRRVFALLEFDSARLELLTCSESLSRRVERFAGRGQLAEGATLSADELIDATGISADRLEDYRRAKLVAPLPRGEHDAEERYCSYSASTVLLCERGVELGVPFESFRTVASHVTLAYELEHGEFLGLDAEAASDGDRLVADLFVRNELAASFVQNVLGALTTRRLREAVTSQRRVGFDRLIYRPSGAFIERYGLEEQLDAAREQLAARPADAAHWSRTAALLLHCGRYREAAFFLEQALARWPLHGGLRAALGRALLLGGDEARGRQALARCACDSDPCSALLLACADYQRALGADQPEVLLRDGAALRERVELALEVAEQLDAPVRLEATMLGGWLLAALPDILGTVARGHQLLAHALDELEDGALARCDPPGLRDRQRINCAYLLLERGGRAGDGADVDALATFVCRLDPACSFARSAYLAAARAAAPPNSAARAGERADRSSP